MRDGWVEYKFKDVAKAVKGKLPKSKNKDGIGTPYLTANYLRSNKPDYWIENLDGAVTAEDGDCLILWDGAGAGDLFSAKRGVVSSTMALLTTQNPNILREFLTLFISSKAEYIKETCRGTTVPHVSPDAIADMDLKIPPLAQQKRIVDLVAALDKAISSYRTFEAESLNLRAAISNGVFNDSSVAISKLGDYCEKNDVQIGPFGSQLHSYDYVLKGIPVVMPQDLINGEISESRIARISDQKASELHRHRLKPGDVLFARRGDLAKRAQVTESQMGWLCGTGSVRVRSKKLNPAVLFHCVSTDEVNSWLLANSVGATMPNLNTRLITEIPIRVPTNVETQVLAIEAMSKATQRARAALKALENLRFALLLDLLSGKHEIPTSFDNVMDAAV